MPNGNFVITLTSLLETANTIAGGVAGADPRVALGVAISRALLDAINAGHKIVNVEVPPEPSIEMIDALRSLGGMNKTAEDYLREAKTQNP